MTPQDNPQSFWDHISELRRVAIKTLSVIGIGTASSLFFYPALFKILTSPLYNLSTGGGPAELLILSPSEGISTVFKTCLWIGLVGSSPLWLLFIFQFIAPALKNTQRNIVAPFILSSLAFLTLGLLLGYYVTIPLANHYLLHFNEQLGKNFWSLSLYLNYTFLLLLSNALAFESCVILLFLVHYRWISAASMVDKRRAVIVAIFIASAILTPPDVLTQLLLALPLMAIYEAAILYARLRGPEEASEA